MITKKIILPLTLLIAIAFFSLTAYCETNSDDVGVVEFYSTITTLPPEFIPHEFYSDDGRYCVKFFNYDHSTDKIILAFYEEGTLIKSYSVYDLIYYLDKLSPLAYPFYHYTFYEIDNTMLIYAIDDINTKIDITTGEVLYRYSTPRFLGNPETGDKAILAIITVIAVIILSKLLLQKKAKRLNLS